MSRNATKAQRLTRLVDLLRARPRRVVELARDFGVSRRSIERDLQAIGTYQPLEKGATGYFIDARGPQLSPVEALAMHSALRLLSHHAQIDDPHYRSLMEKLAKQLPQQARRVVHRSADRLRKQSSKKSRNLDQVAQAWFEGRLLQFDYISASGSGKARRQVLEVYFFEISRTNLAAYVIGYERGYHQAIRVYKLERIRNPMVLQEAYEIPEDFDPLQYLSPAWGIVVGQRIKVKLRFEPAVATAVRELPTHNLAIDAETAHGGLFVTVTAATAKNGLPLDLIPWIRSWGSMVEVLEPEHVRQAIANDLTEAATRYASN